MTNINNFKKELTEAFKKIEQLKDIQKSILEINLIKPNEIYDKIKEAEQFQTSIENLLINLEKQSILNDIKKKMKKRKLKRLKNKRNILNKKTNLQNREKLHKKINESLEILKQNDLELLAQKENSKYAKKILLNINNKKSEAIKNIKLINSLMTLRELKQTKYKLPDPDHDKWYKEMAQLKAVWADALTEYEEEESKLKQFLSFYSKSLEDQWREVLFGTETHRKKQTFNNFLDIRRTWDSCIVQNGSRNSSSIPTGWIFPPKQPSEQWSTYLFKSGRKML